MKTFGMIWDDLGFWNFYSCCVFGIYSVIYDIGTYKWMNYFLIFIGLLSLFISYKRYEKKPFYDGLSYYRFDNYCDKFWNLVKSKYPGLIEYDDGVVRKQFMGWEIPRELEKDCRKFGVKIVPMPLPVWKLPVEDE